VADPPAALLKALHGRYTLEREVGRGGMATVYLARDLKHARLVALKALRPEVAAAVGTERFLREIEIAARLQHPHILALLDSGRVEGGLYYTMPYVAGESLRARLDREPQLGIEEALRIAGEVAEALAYAHNQGVIHRDIKPGNILLESGEAGARVLVADFGIAQALTVAGGERLTATGVAIGTPAYMSPEQAAGSARLDGRSDLYSLGCLLFEMLVGEPPFTGPTVQAVLARHAAAPIPRLRTVRPTASEAVERVVTTALAKVPADRFPTASQFIAALSGASKPPASQRQPHARGRNIALVASAAALGLAGVLWRLFVVAAPERLDPERLVVYPLIISGGGERDASLAENVTDALREALNSTGYVKGIDGWYLLDERQRHNLRELSPERAGALARRQHAGSCVGGRLLIGDSVRVFLEFHDLAADSSLSRKLVFGPGVGAWSMGERAASEILPLLIPGGRWEDLTYLGNPSPAATTSFLQGERAYRRGRFTEAFEHYRNAVQADSTFALAGLKGAQAASWDGNVTKAKEELLRVAGTGDTKLPPRYARLARGFRSYLDFRADSAVREFRLALQLDPESAEAWAGLGEVYMHLLPRDSPLDSLAEAAFAEAHRLDPNFAAVFYHLLEIALRKGDARSAGRLMEQFRNAQPDSVPLQSADLMLRCVKNGPDAVHWRDATLRSPRVVLEAGRALTVAGLHQPDCAKAAWRAILAYDTTSPPSQINFRWGALFGLQSVLLAQGRYREAERLLEQDTVFNPTLRDELYILDAVAGADTGIDSRAAATANRLLKASGSASKDTSSTDLWYLGIWQAHRGRAAEARATGDTLAARAARSGDREESLLARSVLARAALTGGDSAGATKLLQELVPTTGRGALTWNPWESLGGERLLLAELRLARGEFAEAMRVARNFDAPAPVPYVLYLPASLRLRLRAARSLGDEGEARRVRARLVALGRRDLTGYDR
jgi:tetratricopeptide (TPR) repeat protein